MADFYLKSGQATARVNSTAYTAGQKIVIAFADVSTNYAVVRKWVLECTAAGTSGAAIPAWPATVTQDVTVVTDGTCTWTFRKPGYSSGTTADWTFSGIYIQYVVAAMAAGDTLYVSNNHAESLAVDITIVSPGTAANPCKIICVNDTAAPPTAVATTASVITTGSVQLTITGAVYVYGITFSSGSPGCNAYLILNTTLNKIQVYENCNLINGGTGSNCQIFIGSGVNDFGGIVVLKGCGIKFAAATTYIGIVDSSFSWQDGSILSGGTSPNNLLNPTYSLSRPGNFTISGVDFSNLAASSNLVGSNQGNSFIGMIRNCKLPASWNGNIGAFTNPSPRVEMHNCDNANTNYRVWVEDYAGSTKSETTIVRTGGASDGTTALSWKMASSANAKYPSIPLKSVEIVQWNDTVGMAKTVTLEFVHDTAITEGQGAGTAYAFQDDEIWIEVQYLGTSGYPISTTISDCKSNVMAAAADQESSSTAWTTTGMTTPVKQKLSVSITPQEKGFIHATVYLAKASKIVYVDPKLTVA